MNTEALHSETVVKPIKKTKRRLVPLCDIDIIPLKKNTDKENSCA